MSKWLRASWMGLGWGRSAESHWASLWELRRSDDVPMFHNVKHPRLQDTLRECAWLKAGHKSVVKAHQKRQPPAKRHLKRHLTALMVREVKAAATSAPAADFRDGGFRGRSALLSACTLPYTELLPQESTFGTADHHHPGASAVPADANTMALALSRAVMSGTSSGDLRKKLLLQPDAAGLSPLLAVLASGSTKLTREHISQVQTTEMEITERHRWLTHCTADKITAMHAVLMSGNKGNLERLLSAVAQARLPEKDVWTMLTRKTADSGATPLHTAAGCSSAAGLERLLHELQKRAPSHGEYKAALAAQTADGYTCLHHVLARGDLDAATVLTGALQNPAFDADWQRETFVHRAANVGLTPTDAATVGGHRMLDSFRHAWYNLLVVKPHVRSMDEHRQGLVQVLTNADEDSAAERVRALQLNALPLGHRQELLCDGTVLHAALVHKPGNLANAVTSSTFATFEEAAAANANENQASSSSASPARTLMTMLRSRHPATLDSTVGSAGVPSPPLIHLLCTTRNLLRRTRKAVAAAGVSSRSMTDDVLLQKCKQTRMTPLAFAVANGSAQSVMALNEWAGRWPVSGEERAELVRLCCKRTDPEGLLIAEYVLRELAGRLTPAEASVRCDDGYAPLHNILRHGTDEALRAFLLFAGGVSTGGSRDGNSNWTKRRLQTVWGVLSQDADNMSSLHFAINRGPQATKVLLSAFVEHASGPAGPAKLWTILTEPDRGGSKMPPLVRAFRHQPASTVPILLDIVASLDQDHLSMEALLLSSCAEGYTPLHGALQSGNSALLKRVLWLKHCVSLITSVDDEAFLTRKARNGMSPLHFALAGGDADCIGRYLALLSEAEKLDVKVYHNLLTRAAAGRTTPLISVLMSGSAPALKMYLHTLEDAALPPDMHDACLTTSTRSGLSPLMVVVENGDKSCFDMLWAALATFALNPRAQLDMLMLGDNRGFTPLHSALKRPASKEMIDAFFAALHVEEELCEAELMGVLLHQTSDRWTPLHQAAVSSCSLQVIEALVTEIRTCLGDAVLLKNLAMETRQGHTPSRPSSQTDAATVNSFLAKVKADALQHQSNDNSNNINLPGQGKPFF